MKKIAFLAALFLLATVGTGWSATFLNTYLDLGTDLDGTAIGGDLDTTTDLFYEMNVSSETTSFVYYDGTVLDAGNFLVTSLDFASGGSNDENIGAGWEMTASWDNLTGYMTQYDSSAFKATYTGGTMSFYIDIYPTMTAADFNFDQTDDETWGKYSYDGTTWSTDNSNFEDGQFVVNVEIVSGRSTYNFDGSGGSYQLTGKFVNVPSALNGLWYDENGNDLFSSEFFTMEYLFGYADGNFDTAFTEFNDQSSSPIADAFGNFGVITYTQAHHEGSFKLSVVPEPSTMLLLGFGLIGCAAVSRRKFKK